MSAKRVEYHPLYGGSEPNKKPSNEEGICEREEGRISSPYGGSEPNKKPSNEEGLCEREEGRISSPLRGL